jgi:hypothetical protein
MSEFDSKLSEIYSQATLNDMRARNLQLDHYQESDQLAFMHFLLIKLAVYFGDYECFDRPESEFELKAKLWAQAIGDLTFMQIVRALFVVLSGMQEEFKHNPRPNQFHFLAKHGRQNRTETQNEPLITLEDLQKSCNTELAERHLLMMWIRSGSRPANEWVKQHEPKTKRELWKYYQFGAGETENTNFDIFKYIKESIWKQNTLYDKQMQREEIRYYASLPD